MTPQKYHAFVPNPLPPQLRYERPHLLKTLAHAERTIGALQAVGDLIPNPDLMIVPSIRLEAVTSSRIEGTQASLSELFYFEAADNYTDRAKVRDDVLEVHNYVQALNHGIALLDQLPLSLRLLQEVHRVLMRGVRGSTSDKTPGEFRRSQNWIGGTMPNDAIYVPPPAATMLELLAQWENFIHADTDFPPLIQTALLHYQFEAIHPFLDGNGRVGRLMIMLFLMHKQILTRPLLYISPYFERYRDRYYDCLLNVSRHGDWEAWIEFFLLAVVEQGEHASRSAKRIYDERERLRLDLQTQRASASALMLLDLVFKNPYVTARSVVDALGITMPTAQKAIDRLQAMGLLEEITRRERNRVYVAARLFEILTHDEQVYRPD